MALIDTPLAPTAEAPGSSVTRWIRTLIAALSFWSAIALPVLYLPFLASGIETTTGLITFFGLFGLHVLALLGGRSYHRSPE